MSVNIWKNCLLPILISVLFVVACSDKKGTGADTASGAQVTTESEPTLVQQKKEIWTCPMHPQIRKDGPGTCPICGMNLVKANSTSSDAEMNDEMPEGHAPFGLSLRRQQMIGVKLGIVEKKPLYKSIEAAGRVAFDPELYTAQNEYLEAIRQLARVQDSPIADVKHSAERMVQSAKLRLKILGLSDQQIQQIGESRSSGSNLLLPRKGGDLLVYAEVFEMDLPSIEAGLEATISGGALGGKRLGGKVISIDRVINPATRTAKVRIHVPNARSELRPESYVDVSIRSPLGDQVTVPFDAVFDTGKQAWVFVAKEEGRFEPRLVSVKFRTDDQIAIAEGVSPGEKIVTSANFLIDSESRLSGISTSGAEVSDKTPDCPKGQFWHAEMKHCMPKVGG